MKKFNNFITFEGPEGSGKSTIAKMVKEYYDNKDLEVVLTREPGGTGLQFAEDIRTVIMNNGEIDTLTEALLFQSSRSEHLDKLIIPSISDRKMVICDRFADSSTVYQGIVQDLGKETVEKLNEITVGDNWPSLTILFDLDPETGLSRINSNDRETNRFDAKSLEFHNKVREAYLLLEKENERIVKVDASKSIDEVFEQVINIIERAKND